MPIGWWFELDSRSTSFVDRVELASELLEYLDEFLLAQPAVFVGVVVLHESDSFRTSQLCLETEFAEDVIHQVHDLIELQVTRAILIVWLEQLAGELKLLLLSDTPFLLDLFHECYFNCDKVWDGCTFEQSNKLISSQRLSVTQYSKLSTKHLLSVYRFWKLIGAGTFWAHLWWCLSKTAVISFQQRRNIIHWQFSSE